MDAYWNAKDEFEHDVKELFGQFISPEEFEKKWRSRLKSEYHMGSPCGGCAHADNEWVTCDKSRCRTYKKWREYRSSASSRGSSESTPKES